VRFQVRLTDGFKTIRRCTCSYCRMRGAVAASADLDGIRFIAGEHLLSIYQFNTLSAKHYFCSNAGSTRIINDAPTRPNLESMWLALKV